MERHMCAHGADSIERSFVTVDDVMAHVVMIANDRLRSIP
jgi:hypothetical protein